jgi:hypothetical protein
MGIFRGSGGAVDSTRNAVANQVSIDSATAAAKALEASLSAQNAASDANNIAATFDNFDDTYLGAKASDPSVDNDGDSLKEGALYFNTTTNKLRYYDGLTWHNTFNPSDGYYTKAEADARYAALLSSDRTMKFYRQATAPSGLDLQEGDMWYETDTENVYFWRETGGNIFSWVLLSTGTDDSDTLDGGAY